MRKIIGVDMDGTMTKGKDAWTPKECLLAEPNWSVIEWVNRKFEDNYIVVATARQYSLAEATLKWLDKYNVKYNAIVFRKPAVDILVDDRCVNVKDLFSEHYS